MSRTLDYLRDIQSKRESGDYSSAKNILLKAIPDYPSEAVAQSQPENGNAISKNGIFYALILLLFLISLILNLGLFTMIKGSQAEKATTIAKLNQIEDLLKGNTKQISVLTTSSEDLNCDTNAKIAELEKRQDSQSLTIATLTKAQDVLFRRISELENKESPK